MLNISNLVTLCEHLYDEITYLEFAFNTLYIKKSLFAFLSFPEKKNSVGGNI